jgi:hypothetical protein
MDLLELFAAYNAESLMIPFPFLSMALANAGRFEEAAECIGIYDQGHHGYLQGIDVSSLYQRHIQKLEKALGKASFEAAKTLGASKPPEDFRHLIDELESA